MPNNSVVSDLCAMVQDSVDRLGDEDFVREVELRCGRKTSAIALSTKRRIRPTVMQVSMLDREGLVFTSQGILRADMMRNCAGKDSLHRKFLNWAADTQVRCLESEVLGAFLDSGFLATGDVVALSDSIMLLLQTKPKADIPELNDRSLMDEETLKMRIVFLVLFPSGYSASDSYWLLDVFGASLFGMTETWKFPLSKRH